MHVQRQGMKKPAPKKKVASKPKVVRHRQVASLTFSPEGWEVIRGLAERKGLTASRYLEMLARSEEERNPLPRK